LSRARKTLAFLCTLLSLDPPGFRRDELRRALSRKRVSWPWLVRLASEHQVAPGVSNALARWGLRDALPADLVDYFEAIAALNRERNERIRQDAMSLGAMLSGVGILPVFLKGTADLLTGLRPDPGERMQQDIDILVPADSLVECARLLRQNGYESEIEGGKPLAHHAPPLWRAGDAATVELHSDVLAYPFANLLPAEETLASARRITCAGAIVGVPAPFARVVHLVAHAQLVDLGLAYGRVGLRQALDLAYLAERYRGELDWSAVHVRHGQAAALEVLLCAARRLVDAPVLQVKTPSLWAAMQCRRAVWQAGAPRVTGLTSRLLRPPLLLGRSLSDKAHRRQLLRNLADGEWLKRQVRHLVG
jgi:hypothetical protein